MGHASQQLSILNFSLVIMWRIMMASDGDEQNEK